MMPLLLRWVVVNLLGGLVWLLKEFFASKLFGTIIGAVLLYSTIYYVDAANVFLGWLRQNMPDIQNSFEFAGAGSLVQALRLDDCLVVLLGAYVVGWTHRLIFKFKR